jgi:hypothetical protein
MEAYVPLFVALVWPITIVLLLIIFRNPIKALIRILYNRLERGDKLSAFGVSIEPVDPKLGLPSVISTGEGKSTQSLRNATGVEKYPKLLIAIGESPLLAGYDASGLMGIGDTLAVATIFSAFRNFQDLEISTSVIRSRYANAGKLIDDNPNVITIGGPDANNLTRNLMLSYPFNLVFSGLDVVDKLSKQRYEAEISSDISHGKDWGIIWGLPNQAYKGGRIVIIAGCYGFGTNGAGLALAQIDEYPLLSSVASKGYFEALVEVKVKNGVVDTLNLVLARNISL